MQKKQKSEAQAATIKKGNQIIAKQHQIQIVSEALLERDKENAQSNISGRHQEAASIMKDAYGNIMENFVEDFSQSAYTSVIDEEDVLTNKEIDNHKVTGYELNDRIETIQNHLIDINTTNNKTIKEFREIYNALDALDKDYMTSIVASVKAIEKTSNDVRTQQGAVSVVIIKHNRLYHHYSYKQTFA